MMVEDYKGASNNLKDGNAILEQKGKKMQEI